MEDINKYQHSLGFSFLTLGYRDYIAARFLLNNNFIIQGVTLASTAFEKYLKAILAISGKPSSGHLNNKLSEFKDLLKESYYDITEFFDDRFLKILSNVYKIRYYDKIQKPIQIGFFINQFIGELDFAISFIENKVILNVKNQNGEIVNSPYKHDVEVKEHHLFFNNYILNDLPKKDHMEKIDNGFIIYVDSNNPEGELIGEGTNIKNKYNGKLTEIHFNILKEKNF